ncbi:MAG: hypothetical protein IPG72_12815 [Ardenticatenales bacterium]|nr:hypothetical protein [Ardenticatenales bacterium]
MSRRFVRFATALTFALALVAPAAHVAHADGGPSNALLIIDPTDADSLYLGHVYAARRSIPAGNVLYLPPAAADYASWAAFQRHAVTGTLAARGLAHVDHIVISPSKRFFIPMPTNLVSTGCGVVSRMSLSSAYTFLPEADEILGGKLSDQDLNRYRGAWRRPSDAVAFDSRTRWYNGKPATSGGARRYFVGTLLGYLGERGNTVDEVAAMIERSTAADGTRPDGTFYFMTTPDGLRSYRREDFPAVIQAITDLGGKAEALDGVVPLGRHDALGILTGITHPAVVGADTTLLPGSFADHLTSFAAMYDEGGQEKMSSWITAGASATLGTVEEPCTGGKFPDAALHAFYFAGLPLGEAIFRSVQWSAFQSLFLGDPLTRPFTHVPTVDVEGLPGGTATVKGIVPLTARATTAAPGGTIAAYTLYVDGIAIAAARDGRFALDTTALLAEGWHEVRITAVDASPVRAVGEWRGGSPWAIGAVARACRRRRARRQHESENDDRPSVVQLPGHRRRTGRDPRPSGQPDRSTSELALAQRSLPATWLGAGPSSLRAVAEYADGGAAVSRPVRLDIPPSAAALPAGVAPNRGAPFALGYTVDVRPGRPQLIDVVAWDNALPPDHIVVDAPPSQSDVRQLGNTLLLLPHPSAKGTDTLAFHATNPDGWQRRPGPRTMPDHAPPTPPISPSLPASPTRAAAGFPCPATPAPAPSPAVGQPRARPSRGGPFGRRSLTETACPHAPTRYTPSIPSAAPPSRRATCGGRTPQ